MAKCTAGLQLKIACTSARQLNPICTSTIPKPLPCQSVKQLCPAGGLPNKPCPAGEANTPCPEGKQFTPCLTGVQRGQCMTALQQKCSGGRAIDCMTAKQKFGCLASLPNEPCLAAKPIAGPKRAGMTQTKAKKAKPQVRRKRVR